MKRDLDLVRSILLEIEGWQDTDGHEVEIAGYSHKEITYNAFLLEEAGYIEAITSRTFSGDTICPIQLTWKGHEFLDEARDKTVWKKAKQVAEKAGASSLAIFRTILAKVAASEAEHVLDKLIGQ